MPPFAALVATLLLSAALFALRADGAAPLPSPWPLSRGHDSGHSSAAGGSVPVYAFYDSASLSLQWPQEITLRPDAFIAGQGIYVLRDTVNVTVYNRTIASTSVLSMPQGSSPYVLGFDPTSSLRLYFYFLTNEVSFGAYSLQTRSTVWSLSNASMGIVSIVADTFSDSIYVTYTAGATSARVPFLARYDGATGKVLWTQATGIANAETASIMCNLPTGALISQHVPNFGTITAHDPRTGNNLWSYNAETVYSSLAFGDVLINLGSPLFVLNSTTGAYLWNSTATVKGDCAMTGDFASIQLGAALGLVAACVNESAAYHLLVLDARSGKLLYKTNTGLVGYPMLISLATVGANVFYAGATGVFRWNPFTAQVGTLYKSNTPLSGLYVDSDGSLLVLPSSPGPLVLISPHLH